LILVLTAGAVPITGNADLLTYFPVFVMECLKNLRLLFAMSLVAWGVISCGPTPQTSVYRPYERGKILSEWMDDGGAGKVRIWISLSDQIAEIERGGRKIGWCYVATGREGYSTKPGQYKIMEKIVDKYSNRYGWIEDELGNVVVPAARVGTKTGEGMMYVAAPMPYWMRLTSYGIGMHGGLIPEPGKPASHGCIRLPKDFVPKVYDVVQVGTPVTISQERSVWGMARARLRNDTSAEYVGAPPVY